MVCCVCCAVLYVRACVCALCHDNDGVMSFVLAFVSPNVGSNGRR